MTNAEKIAHRLYSIISAPLKVFAAHKIAYSYATRKQYKDKKEELQFLVAFEHGRLYGVLIVGCLLMGIFTSFFKISPAIRDRILQLLMPTP
jgi:hypothetical protein